MNINLLLENIEKLNISLSPEELKNFLKISRRWPLNYYGDKQKTVEIIDNYGEMRINDFFDYKGYLIYEKWQKYYDLGFTSIISHCNDLNENLRNLNDLILNFTGNIPNINIYFSKGLQKNSFDKHSKILSMTNKIFSFYLFHQTLFFLMPNLLVLLESFDTLEFHKVLLLQNYDLYKKDIVQNPRGKIHQSQ